MVHLHADLVGHGRRHQLSIGGRIRIGVYDGEEIVALVRDVTRPSEQIMTRRLALFFSSLHRRVDKTQSQRHCLRDSWHG
jgi:hypothetical protein